MASKHLFKTALTSNSSTRQEELGALRREYDSTNGFRTFKYVQCSLTTDASNGRALAWYDAKGTVATDDISTTVASLPAGVAIDTITAVTDGGTSNNYYAWIQVGGYHSAVDTDGDAAITDGCGIVLSDHDGVVERCMSTIGSVKIIGVATADESSSTVAALLDCLYGDIIQ